MHVEPVHTALVDHLRLARAEGVGPAAWRRLLGRYGSPAQALEALPALAKMGGRSEAPRVPSAAEACRELEGLRALGGRLLVLGQPGYPALLALLDDAPPILSVVGDVATLSERAVALVGGRNASANGQRMAATLAEELAAAGLVIVSGLARGVDAAAHTGALRSGRTVAAVAGGLDQPYPPEHAELQRRVAVGGAVLTEAPLGTVPQARHFPRRNRLAGLGLGVVVIEAAPRSGSLITARLAQEAGRELFAVPGSPLDPRAGLQRSHPPGRAPHRDSIRRPRQPSRSPVPGRNRPRAPLRARHARRFWGASAGLGGARGGPRALAAARSQVIELLDASPTAVDDLVRRCQFSPAAVMAVLLELELAGRIETLSGARVALLTP
jgi:DNA processing protein